MFISKGINIFVEQLNKNNNMRLITREKYARLKSAYERIMSIYDAAWKSGGEEVWSDAYDAIFGGGLCRIVRESAPNFDWYDPDASYEEDVSAFVWELRAFMRDIRIV